jgi:AAA15 family ATPase/GTPase
MHIAMRIRLIEIENFRGIKQMAWSPGPGMNCLIGPGDATKTTILDAIELALYPRSYSFADDSDFHNLNVKAPINITVSIGDLPTDFKADNKYGQHLRGWSLPDWELHDEPGEGLEDILSIRLTIDEALEARWGLFNQRIAQDDSDPPMIRYKDMKTLTTTRLGPYAERHLGWGRQSVLGQLEDSGENVNLRLAEAGRAARRAFKTSGTDVFTETVAKVEKLSRDFAVPVNHKYKAELDIQSVSLNTGGIALHDGDLPLRRLGAGSSRLLVSALQRDAANHAHIALIDEIEHGLEPHRIARLLKYLKTPIGAGGQGSQAQIFMTTHSPVVIRELIASDLHTVQSKSGVSTVNSVAATSRSIDKTQAHLRASPEAFLARKILVGEGRTEMGLARGLDVWWTSTGKESFAFLGVVAIHGDGKDDAPEAAESLLDLGYAIALLLDADKEPNAETLARVKAKGGVVIQWEGSCSTEERVFLDLPWAAVIKLIHFAEGAFGGDAILAHINNACADASLPQITDLSLPSTLDTEPFRRALGRAAKKKGWFKAIDRAEAMAAIIAEHLHLIPRKPTTKTCASSKPRFQK